MVIVVSAFRLAQGVAEDDFLAANERTQTEFAYALPGLVRRTTARGADGEWLILSQFRTREDADAARDAAASDPVPEALAAMVDAESLGVKRFETLD